MATSGGLGSRASAANLAALPASGAILAAGPGSWSVPSTPAAGAQASATRAAGGAGVRHVATMAIVTFSATTALAAISTLTVNLRDGATGAGAVLAALQWTLPAAVVAAVCFPIPLPEIVGSAATAMTLESAAAIGNLMVSVTLCGYDAA